MLAVVVSCFSFQIFFFSFAPLFPTPPALCRYLLLRVVFVRKTAVSYLFRVVLPVQQESVLQHVSYDGVSLAM